MVIFGISVRCRTGFQVRKQEFLRKNGGNIMATTGYELVKELTSVMKASALFDEYNDLRT